jgi:histidinol-phosphatase (PHP family)
LESCIEQGIALDINTAALRRSASVLTPGGEILSWFREMGGEKVTLGSDAHLPDHVGADLELALESARAAGLKYVTQFEHRQARMVKIG